MKFRFVCRVYFDTSKARQDVDPIFASCPTECVENRKLGKKYFDAHRLKFCDECPNKKSKDNFKRQTTDLIFELFGEKDAAKFRFERFEQTLYQIINLQEMEADKISVKVNSLLSVYYQEKNRFERIEEIERENERKN